MAEVSTIVGITFMVIGSLLVSLGLFLCYTTKVCKTFSLMDTFSIACKKQKKFAKKTGTVNVLKAFFFTFCLQKYVNSSTHTLVKACLQIHMRYSYGI